MNKEVLTLKNKDCAICDKINMIFSGSLIVSGTGVCLVCETGKNT